MKKIIPFIQKKNLISILFLSAMIFSGCGEGTFKIENQDIVHGSIQDLATYLGKKELTATYTAAHAKVIASSSTTNANTNSSSDQSTIVKALKNPDEAHFVFNFLDAGDGFSMTGTLRDKTIPSAVYLYFRATHTVSEENVKNILSKGFKNPQRVSVEISEDSFQNPTNQNILGVVDLEIAPDEQTGASPFARIIRLISTKPEFNGQNILAGQWKIGQHERIYSDSSSTAVFKPTIQN